MVEGSGCCVTGRGHSTDPGYRPGDGQGTGIGPEHGARVVMAEEAVGVAVEVHGLTPHVPDELLTLYFENRRRSGGGPVLSWQRLGHGGILTFREPEDAQRVLDQAKHQLQGAWLCLRPAPPCASTRLLLQGLPPGTTPQRLEQHVQALLCAIGHPVQPCHALASPRPDRALVQLSMPLPEADFRILEEQAQNLDLDGASVSLARVPQARAVRVIGDSLPVDLLLLELYLENERRSGGGPLEGLHSLPRQLGTVISFQQWQTAEQVLQRNHWLQGSELSLVPHYEVLEPEELAEGTAGGDHPSTMGPGAIHYALPEAGRLAGSLKGAVDSGEAPGQLRSSLGKSHEGSPGQVMLADLGAVRSLEQERLVNQGPMGLLEQEGPMSLGTIGSAKQAGLKSPEPKGCAGPVGPMEISMRLLGQEDPGPLDLAEEEALLGAAMSSLGQEGLVWPVEITMKSPEKAGLESPGHVGLLGQVGLVEMVLSMEPGAMRFLQLYHEDLLASLGDVTLFPLEGIDVTGFRLCGAQAPCQAAQELLQSLLGSISCHMLSLRHPGSARFLLGMEGQCLLQGLEAQFQCVFGTEQLANATVDMKPEEVDPTEALQVLPAHSHTLWLLESTGSDQENVSLEEVQEMLATLESLDSEHWQPLELREEKPEEQPEDAATPGQEEEATVPGAGEEPVAPNIGTPEPEQLKEEAALQLALYHSLESQDWVAEQKEAATLRRALALSLLEAEEPLGGSTGNGAQLVVHVPFEQDVEELDRALMTALEEHLQEETVRLQGHVLPEELCAPLERYHGVSVAPQGDSILLRGFGAQPARAARHLAALLAGPWNSSLAFPFGGSDTTLPEQRLEEPLGRLESLAESTREFQEVVKAFCDSLDAAHSRICIIQVQRVSHPLLEQQYQLHRDRLVQRCTQQPAEQVLYHGTSASTVPEICEHGFNRSFCGRNGTLYGRGVYFAKRASLSVQDRYSPPNDDGHKAVFVARVLTGDYGQGCRSLRAPPLRAGHTLLRYDSAVNCLQQPSIFVIFHDTQALPTHLITCKRLPHASRATSLGLLGP
ncbi:poly [ADP-ribose] polymerase 10 isoform X28 [Heterocephalus glaber]|uniref:Poly [ADP-ribose] polymerase n=2 Tax=Heterocephalus glaber TaxID=10181 RepID=A0AAX6NVJ1_HETGA|nr:poly [ADP-ribose] polymerase 10 isoform X28 [Heterocephalus glaber]